MWSDYSLEPASSNQKFRAAQGLINLASIPMSMHMTWKEREPAIKALVPDLLRALVVLEAHHPVTIRVFFCDGVMAVVDYLRETTRAMEPGATHHVFKILAKHAFFGDRGRLEVPSKGERMDIYHDDTLVSVSVKTIVMATLKAIRGTTMAILDAPPADKTWIFFFYKFKGNASPCPPCKYLITWVDIDSLDLGPPTKLVKQVITMVTKAKEKAAKQLGVQGKIMIPVQDIIKVEDLEREVAELTAEKNQMAIDKDTIISEKETIISEKEAIISEKDREISELKRRIADMKQPR